MVLNTDELRDFKGTSEKTKSLVQKLSDATYLTPEVLDEIAHWKLLGQYARNAKRLAMNSPEDLSIITESVFECPPTTDLDVRLKVKMLKNLNGIGIGMASAILALRFPEYACVVDFRGWRQLFGCERRSFTTHQYLCYVRAVREITEELKWALLDVDIAIWEKDRLENPITRNHPQACC